MTTTATTTTAHLRLLRVSVALVLALVLVCLPTRGAAHGMNAESASTDYKCPVCRMSTLKNNYNNQNWVEMTNGQKVYACGMDPRPFEAYPTLSLTDASYLGANMAEFIVSKSDTENYACDDQCPECADGLKDPITGIDVTTDNFKIVCLVNGQKIYFASDFSRTTYLEKVNQGVRASVQNVMCNGQSCSDSQQIQELSPAAKAFTPTKEDDTTPAPAAGSGSASTTPTTSSSSGTTTTDSSAKGTTDANTEDSESAADSGFCSGEGSVMFNGFQSTINGSCVMLFFQPWVLNSAFKYVLGFFGCLLMALGNEYLVKFREQTRKKLLVARRERVDDKMHKLQCKALLASLYMVQMTVAYFAMLVVMTYETGLFIALILGFGAGFVLFKDFDMDVTSERGVWRYSDPSVVRIRVEGMSCMKNCGTTVENALVSTEGVTKAFVNFEEKCAYVAGVAPPAKLVEAVEAVGFTAQVDQNADLGFIPTDV